MVTAAQVYVVPPRAAVGGWRLGMGRFRMAGSMGAVRPLALAVALRMRAGGTGNEMDKMEEGEGLSGVGGVVAMRAGAWGVDNVGVGWPQPPRLGG